MPYPFLMDLRIARETGHDGVLIVGDKLRRYLDEGFSVEQATAALDGLPVLGMNNIRDVERSSTAGRSALLAETEAACRLARAIGCPSMQLLTGPLDPSGPYRDPLDMKASDLARETAANLRQIGAIGRQFGVDFYIEPLGPGVDAARQTRSNPADPGRRWSGQRRTGHRFLAPVEYRSPTGRRRPHRRQAHPQRGCVRLHRPRGQSLGTRSAWSPGVDGSGCDPAQRMGRCRARDRIRRDLVLRVVQSPALAA